MHFGREGVGTNLLLALSVDAAEYIFTAAFNNVTCSNVSAE